MSNKAAKKSFSVIDSRTGFATEKVFDLEIESIAGGVSVDPIELLKKLIYSGEISPSDSIGHRIETGPGYINIYPYYQSSLVNLPVYLSSEKKLAKKRPVKCEGFISGGMDTAAKPTRRTLSTSKLEEALKDVVPEIDLFSEKITNMEVRPNEGPKVVNTFTDQLESFETDDFIDE